MKANEDINKEMVKKNELNLAKSGDNSNISQKSRKYLLYLLVVLIICQILDSYTSDGIAQRITAIVVSFFPNEPFDLALAKYQMASAFISLGLILIIFTQSISDRYGRKNLLLITTGLMTFIPLLQIFIFDFTLYIISAFFLAIATQADIWAIYVNEEAPQGKNGTWTALVFFGGIIGGLLIPVMRGIYITDDPATSNWRGMLYLSVILGFAITLVIIFTIKETTAFQIKQLQLTTKIHDEKKKLTIKEILRLIFVKERRKGMIGVYAIGVAWIFSSLFVKLIEPYAMTYTPISSSDYNIVLTFTIIGIGLGYPVTGILADKVGRKKMLLLYSLLMPISQILTLIWAMQLQDPVLRIILSSLLATLATASLYGIWILMIIVIIEMVPTETRGVAAGVKAAILAIIGSIANFLTAFLIPIWSLLVILVISCCVMFIAIPLIIVLIPETKGRDLKAII